MAIKFPNQNDNIFSCTSSLSATGDLKRLEGIDIIVDMLYNLLSIPEGTYIDDPNFGTKLHRYVFEPLTDSVVSDIIREIRFKVVSYMGNLVSIQNILPLKIDKGVRIIIDLYINNRNVKLELDQMSDKTNYRVLME